MIKFISGRAVKSSCLQLFESSNRAAAFLRVGKEMLAIKDAEKSIDLNPAWTKGYFHKGRALFALRR
jgi:hypothetical protein